jgi:hypothetical protein
MNISVKIVQFPFIDEINDFFDRNLDDENDAIYNEEFFCKFGIKKAIRVRHIAIAVIDNKIIGAARFYPRKNDNVTSLYQFAVDKVYRNKGVMNLILEFLPGKSIEALCPINSDFNSYYKKVGWQVYKGDKEFFVWRFSKVELS